jgi:hypothetical protein
LSGKLLCVWSMRRFLPAAGVPSVSRLCAHARLFDV